DAGARIVPREFASGEAEARDRAAERLLVDLDEIEARLERKAAQRRADGRALDLQRAGRQLRVAHLAAALKLDGAYHRTVGIDAALAARALETGVVEHLADDEATRFIRAHVARQRRHCRHQTGG